MSGKPILAIDLKKILAGAQLPALPQSAIRLLELSQDVENGPAEFAVPIESDPGLAGQVLRFVNSSYFGFAKEISSVKFAITLVGVRTIKNFALWSAVFNATESQMLAERMELNSAHGRDVMGILLFQDLAVVPLLIVFHTPPCAVPT